MSRIQSSGAVKPFEPLSFLTSWLISMAVTALLMVAVLHDYEGSNHWFLIPTFLYGSVLGKDVFDWVRGELDTFDPLAIFALMAFVRGFLSSVVCVSTGEFLRYVEPPSDWRPWVGAMALINFLGYLTIKCAARSVEMFPRRRGIGVWEHSGSQFGLVLWVCICISLLANLLKFALTGVLTNPMLLFNSRIEFSGLGQILAFSEPLPLLVTFFVVRHWHKKNRRVGTFSLAAVMFALFLLTMFVGGLRGSRSTVIVMMFLSLGTIHYVLRPISRRWILVGGVCAFAFIYVYGFYKHNGVDGLVKAMTSSVERQRMAASEKGEGRWYSRVVGGGTNAYSLYRIMRVDTDYEYAMGETYVGGLSRLVPSFIWPDRPPGITKTGTDLLYGADSWPYRETSLVWGLSGEAMLNFGPIAAVLASSITGLLIGFHRYLSRNLDRNDARLFLLPTLFYVLLVVDGASSRQLPFEIFKWAFLTVFCVVAGSRRTSGGRATTQSRARPQIPVAHRARAAH